MTYFARAIAPVSPRLISLGLTSFLLLVSLPAVGQDCPAGTGPVFWGTFRDPDTNLLRRQACIDRQGRLVLQSTGDPLFISNSNGRKFTTIQAALDIGGEISVPPGTFSTTGLTITDSNVTLNGSGVGVTIISNTSASGHTIDIDNSPTQILHVTISNMTLTSTAPTTGSGIRINQAGRIFLDHVQINSHGRGVFYDTDSFDVFLSDSHFRDNTEGLHIEGGANGNGYYVDGLTINCNDAASSLGIVWTTGSGIYFDNIDIRACASQGVLFNPGAAESALFGFFTAVLSDSSTSQGWLFGGSGNIFSVHLTDCWASSGDNTGIQFNNTNTDGIYLTGFRSLDNDGHGLFLNNTGGGLLSVTNSIFAGNSNASTNTSHGAVILAGATNFKFLGNRFGPDAGRIDSQNTGLLIQVGASDNYVVTGNDFRRNLTAQFTNGATGSERSIADNIPASTGIVFANLGTPGNGQVIFCSDCTIANPCAGGGTGALAKRLNGVWVCN